MGTGRQRLAGSVVRVHTIEVTDLTVRRGDVTAVDGLTFHVDAGEIVALLGANGAGKTSTMETLEGYLVAESGTATILGVEPTRRAQIAERVGVQLQEDGVYPAARPIDVVAHFRRLFGDVGPTAADLLDEVGLTKRATTTIRRLSGGEKRRLGLALALVGEPDVLLLDEPTSGVDHQGRHELLAVLEQRRDAGAATLLTTHELDQAQRLADRIVIIDSGRLVASGTPEELTRATASSGIRFSAEPDLDLTYLVIILGAQIEEVAPGEYLAATTPTPDAVAKLTTWMAERQIMLGEVRAGRHRLEDVFDRLTSNDAGTSHQPRGRSRR